MIKIKAKVISISAIEKRKMIKEKRKANVLAIIANPQIAIVIAAKINTIKVIISLPHI
jgi:hypothetical protein